MKVGIWGISGKMGKMLYETIKGNDEFKVVFGVDLSLKETTDKDISYYQDSSKVNENVDIIIDFSNHNSTSNLLDLAKRLNVPLLICSTGQTCKDLTEIHYAATRIPIMLTPNTSIGSAFIVNIARNGAKYLKGKFDIDITETHCVQKKDMPSGTAMVILNAVLSVNPNLVPIYTWYDHPPRMKDQVVVTSRRIDNTVGEHEVTFTNYNESITIKHEVFDRKVFALGALECAKFLCGKPVGFYTMEDMIKTEKKVKTNDTNLEPEK